MKVSLMKKQIDALYAKNPNAEVRMHKRDGNPALFFMDAGGGDYTNIWLQDESDVNMTELLNGFFDPSITDGVDELDFFTELWETGITIEDISTHVGKEKAEYTMKFWKEHGLPCNRKAKKDELKMYWVSAIVQYEKGSNPCHLAMTNAALSMEKAAEIIKKIRMNYYATYQVWVEMSEGISTNRTTVFHKCYVDSLGQVERVENQ